MNRLTSTYNQVVNTKKLCIIDTISVLTLFYNLIKEARMPVDIDSKINFYLNVLSRIDNYIQLIGSKITTHLAVLATIITAITAMVGWGLELDISNIKESATIPINIVGIIFYITFLFFCYWWYDSCDKIINPDLSRIFENQEYDVNYLSTIFFEDIRKNETTKIFVDKVKYFSKEQILEDLLIQIHIVSSISSKKYNDYNKISKWKNFTIINSLILVLIIFISKQG